MMDVPKYGNDIPYTDDILPDLHNSLCKTDKEQTPKEGLESYLRVNINNAQMLVKDYFDRGGALAVESTTVKQTLCTHFCIDPSGFAICIQEKAYPASVYSFIHWLFTYTTL
jgi:hypothetical protein